MSEIGGVRRVRFGLASKFTAPVSLALSLVIILMGVVVYHSTANGLETQINQQGIFAARIAAAPEIDSWDRDYNTFKDLQTRLAAIDAEMALAGARLNGEATPPTTEQQQELLQKIAAHDSAQQGFNLRRLGGLLGSQGALDVWIVTADQALKASASGKSTVNFETPQHFKIASSPETLISTGVYENMPGTPRNTWEPARFFRHPIKDRGGSIVGYATVVFSERGLREDLRTLKAEILLFCVLGVLTCALVAFISSKLITRPLGFLLRDIKAVADGDLEHRTLARSQDEIGTLASAFDQMTRNLAAAEIMRVDLADKEHQVSLAHEIQERLFPRELPRLEGLAIDAANRLAADLSADLFDVLMLQDGRVGMLVMTASGRGVPAAIVLSMARSIFHASCQEISSPAEALRAINTLLSPDLRRGMYVSALYAVVDPVSGTGHLASAGHRAPALHYVATSQGLRKLQGSGIAVGLDKGPVFDRSLGEVNFNLASGDRLILSSEGSLQLKDQEGSDLGEDRFMKLTLAACKKGVSAEAILAALGARLGASPGQHDLTLVMACRT